MNKPHTHRVLLATAVPKWFNCLGNFATIRVLMASQWRSASLNLLLLCQSLQEGFEVPKWFRLPLQSSCHGLRYVAVNSLFPCRKLMLKVTQNTFPPTWTGNPQLASWACLPESSLSLSSLVRLSLAAFMTFQNLRLVILHQKQVVRFWRDKGEKLIDCSGKILDE